MSCMQLNAKHISRLYQHKHYALPHIILSSQVWVFGLIYPQLWPITTTLHFVSQVCTNYIHLCCIYLCTMNAILRELFLELPKNICCLIWEGRDRTGLCTFGRRWREESCFPVSHQRAGRISVMSKRGHRLKDIHSRERKIVLSIKGKDNKVPKTVIYFYWKNVTSHHKRDMHFTFIKYSRMRTEGMFFNPIHAAALSETLSNESNQGNNIKSSALEMMHEHLFCKILFMTCSAWICQLIPSNMDMRERSSADYQTSLMSQTSLIEFQHHQTN